jgi:hypothetical protein
MSFQATQTEFAAALLDPARPLPGALTSHSSTLPAKRFAVYRNNVVFGLVKGLRARFPVVERIVGEEFFAGMARLFVTAHPPRSPLLMRYGDEFADFICGFAPAAELAYLPDVARLEAARTRAYHAADAERLDPASLRKLDPQALERLRVDLHPSLETLRSRFPVVTIWAMNSGEAELGPIDESEAQDALILRPETEVVLRLLPPGGAAFLGALRGGATLAQAVSLAMTDDPRFDLAANLAGLIGSGALAGIAVSGKGPPS